MLTRLATELKNIFAKIGHNHDASYEPKNTNIQTHISNTSNPHGTTASQVGLGNVTNNKQLKAAASSTVGKIPIWTVTTGDTLGDGYAVETTLTSNTGNIPVSSVNKNTDLFLGSGVFINMDILEQEYQDNIDLLDGREIIAHPNIALIVSCRLCSF